MDCFPFEEDELNQDLFWNFWPEISDLDPSVPAVPAVVSSSAFVPFVNRDGEAALAGNRGSAGNIHGRALNFLRRMPKSEGKASEEDKASEEGRGFRHMMRERRRREKLSQSYADLYSMVSSISKADKNSIVQSAAVQVRELKGVKENLRRRNEELRARLAKGNSDDARGENVKLRVANPSSAIDSMIESLRCLKSKDVKATTIQFELSDRELSAVLKVHSNKVSAAELEKSVEGALMEVEQKFRAQFPRSSGWSQHCHV